LGARLIKSSNIPTPLQTIDSTSSFENPNTPTNTTEPIADYPEPTSKIVFTCQIDGADNEICIINPDGTGFRQLTDSDSVNEQDASLSPDGLTIVFVSNETGNFEIYEMDLSGKKARLTNLKSYLATPEISPDDQWIVFANQVSGNYQIWLMDRDGKNERMLFSSTGEDALAPTWSPDGKQILIAIGKDENKQLYIMDAEGGDPVLVNEAIRTRGRSDWSIKNLISFFSGSSGDHDIFAVNADGTDLRKILDSINALSPSFSPDGNWIAYTDYTKDPNDGPQTCEIFIMRVDGSDIRRLTSNDYCDLQPRWGK